MTYRWKIYLIRAAIIGVLAALLKWLLGMPTLMAIPLALIAFVINGLVVDIEDALPGGWDNPAPPTVESSNDESD